MDKISELKKMAESANTSMNYLELQRIEKRIDFKIYHDKRLSSSARQELMELSNKMHSMTFKAEHPYKKEKKNKNKVLTSTR